MLSEEDLEFINKMTEDAERRRSSAIEERVKENSCFKQVLSALCCCGVFQRKQSAPVKLQKVDELTKQVFETKDVPEDMKIKKVPV